MPDPNAVDPEPHRCFEIDVDGEPIRVQGDPGMSDESRQALEDLVRAARRLTPEQREAALRRQIERRADG